LITQAHVITLVWLTGAQCTNITQLMLSIRGRGGAEGPG
jgi:hypothetical protein